MKIAIASGKGGTGKTTVAANLFYAMKTFYNNVVLVDTDVEEPNIELFFKKQRTEETPVNVQIPEFIEENCTECGKCDNICEFKALVTIKNKPYIIEDLCKACGLCIRVCPSNALVKKDKKIGKIIHSVTDDNSNIISGELEVGQILTSTLINKVKKHSFNQNGKVYIIDAPPGTTCPAVASIKDSDIVVFVAEPTPYGLKDLKLAVKLAQNLGKPYGVIINKHGLGNGDTEKWLESENIKIFGKIPYLDDIALKTSNGEILTSYASRFVVIAGNILREGGE
ncbi:MAG: ATP-binding protein [Candidatus Muiribacteriota bacterium]